jgi:hypothetical protein
LNVELEGINGTRYRVGILRVVTPREVEGVLNGLLLRLRHVELLVVNLDGFANVGNLVDAVGSLVIDDRQSLRAQGDEMFAGLCRIERLIQSHSSGLASITLSNDALRDLLKAVEEIGENQRASATAAGVRTLSWQSAHWTTWSPTDSNDGHLHPSSGIARDQDAITARSAQVDPKVVRFINAVQKGHMSSADKDKVVVVIQRLLEPWKVNPSRVRYNLRNEIGSGGYGRVSRGKLDGNTVAVKVVAWNLESGGESLKADFLRDVVDVGIASSLCRGVSWCVLASCCAVAPGQSMVSRTVTSPTTRTKLLVLVMWRAVVFFRRTVGTRLTLHDRSLCQI